MSVSDSEHRGSAHAFSGLTIPTPPASSRAIASAEAQLTTTDRTIHSEILRTEEPVAADVPGTLAVAAGRLLRRLASDCLSRVSRQGS